MTSLSDSESDNEKEINSRLGDCEVCGANQAKYTCPKCEVKTCCLQCVVIHKRELECTGIRDRTKFVRMKDFSNTDLLSDYRLLEECARFVNAVKRDEKKKFTRLDKDLPIHLFKLKMAARKRGIVLQFLSQNFTKHIVNTTRYNYKTNMIHWRVEWVFPNVENKPLKFVDEKCSERVKLSELLDKYLNPDSLPFEGSKDLVYYRSAGFSGTKVLLKGRESERNGKAALDDHIKRVFLQIQIWLGNKDIRPVDWGWCQTGESLFPNIINPYPPAPEKQNIKFSY